ncbi:hypothetical protein SXCC_04145 [Gluconacetobacter sp. SXCC-1]|nr:hypothetical protein SXCC_04145 [Gluconacetobacter sp. SXCC-1]
MRHLRAGWVHMGRAPQCRAAAQDGRAPRSDYPLTLHCLTCHLTCHAGPWP